MKEDLFYMVVIRESRWVHHYWGHLDSKASRQYYVSIFLGCWPGACAIRDQHSVPHGKLVAYKSYI